MVQKKQIFTVFSIAIIASAFLFVYANAIDDNPIRLPPTDNVVFLEASNSSQAYFNVTLSDVPEGYDVGNGTYLGWCVDRSAEMTRLVQHTVNLYSSLSPEGELADSNWTMVNYILNHKRGEAQDIQEAIWHFINLNGTFIPESSVALSIVNDAETNGADFVPGENQKAAVIAFPVYVTDPTPVQISIFEVTISASPSETGNPNNGSDGSSGNDFSISAAIIVILIVITIVIAVIVAITSRKKK